MRAIAVIGTGLIGTSVALAARRRGVTVFLSDRDRVAARTAAALGAGRIRPPAVPVDLAVLAVPPSQVGAVLAEQQARGLAHCYTDVASVKALPERTALSLAPDPSSYVGGHPLAGRERSGPLAARAELFEGRPWALTPSSLTSATALRRARELAVLCGAVPVVTESASHDEAVALTSHVPHLLASLMAARLSAGPAGATRFAGQGLRDVTRIAAGDPGLWGDILRSNAVAVTEVIREVHADLARLVDALEGLTGPDESRRAHGMGTLVDLLDRGVAGLGEIRSGARADPADGPRVRVAVADGSGELPRLLSRAAVAGADAERASVEDAGPGRLAVRFGVPPHLAGRVVAALVADGWDARGENGAYTDRYEEDPVRPTVRT
ncbi:prephenate dehydrogenase [Streptomyces sp. NPDC014894]|uniref:prephenate dehydrogenase n=1 Tax=Streptomyces sp. NPDC014894 TaxID=3364931 RepID=UPI0036F7732A